MKNLWAPWRMEFIFSEKGKGCIFCRLAKRKDDRAHFILHRGRYNYVILNIYPYNNGHLMVVPYRHTRDLSKIQPSEYAEMMTLTAAAVRALEATMHPQGHNVGLNLGAAGGAGIRDHVHLHVVPRWVGDTNFMPVLDHTKVMIEYLDQTYDRLAPALRKALQRSRARKRGAKKR